MISLTGQQPSNQTLRIVNEENNILATNYKTINGLGFYSCDICPFLCLKVELFLKHKEKDYHFNQSPLKSLLKLKCIGCDNVYYSITLLRYHLLEDHDCSSIEINGLIQLVIEANKKEDSYLPEEIDQTQNESLADFNNINDAMISTSENNQNLIDPQITEIIIVDNFLSNDESPGDFGDYQEQVFNGFQKYNTNNDQNIRRKRFRCTIGSCKVKFGTRKNLQYHVLCHIKGGFKCVELDCQYEIKSWLTMMLHLWRTHTIDIEMFSCNQCGFRTNNLYRLNAIHKYIHNNEKPFLCPECSKGFHTSKQLKNHKVIHENRKGPAKANLSCLHCSRKFTTESLLHQHIISIQSGARSHNYKGCNNTTAVSSSSLQSHNFEKPFKCIECCYSTASHNSLKRHKMRHTGQKNYNCPLCNYSCIQLCSYKQHLMIHHPGMNNDIVYSCKICNFKTLNKKIFIRHNNKHNKETL